MRISDWSSDVCSSGLALYALRGLGGKLCNPDRPTGSWISIIGKAVSKTTGFFIVMVAVRLVDGYARTPPMLDQLVVFLFTVAAVFQGAIWAREIILGFIEHRTTAEHYRGEAIVNAMGLIRLLVRSEEHTSELQSLMRNSYAVF